MRAQLASGQRPSAPAPKLADYITEGAGCWDCKWWRRIGQAVGHCQCETPMLIAGGSVVRCGTMTCFAYICPLHPKFPPVALASEAGR